MLSMDSKHDRGSVGPGSQNIAPADCVATSECTGVFHWSVFEEQGMDSHHAIGGSWYIFHIFVEMIDWNTLQFNTEQCKIILMWI